MTLYADSKFPVPQSIEANHVGDLRSYGEPGTWWTGAERRAIADTTRAARRAAGVLETRGSHPSAELSPAIKRVVECVAVSPKDCDRGFFESALESGISEGQYVEAVGVVSRLVNLDVFARGLALPLRELPDARGGQPHGERPDAAIDEGAFVPTIPAGRRGGEVGRELYADVMQPFIYRALSLVPDEARRVIDQGGVQYLPIDRFMDYDYAHYPALSRAQVEVMAGRTSAINECFY